MAKVVGRNKGIQGHQNSCYLDATLFAMFSFTGVFDSLLYRPQSQDDIEEYNEVQKVLREEIVNPLRKSLFVRSVRIVVHSFSFFLMSLCLQSGQSDEASETPGQSYLGEGTYVGRERY